MTIFWHFFQLLNSQQGLSLVTALAVFLTIFTTATVSAEEIQPLETISLAVSSASKLKAEKQGYSSVEVEVRPLDSHLRLPLCSKPLSTFTPPGGDTLGAISVGVRCSGEKSWTIYARANVSAKKAIPVLARPLPRNSLITQSDIKIVYQPLEFFNQDVITDADDIIGMELTRALNTDSTIKPNYLRSPKVITRGQQVILVSGSHGLEVRMKGKALKDATAGERVNVTNLSSGQKIEGIANTDGTVSVP
jgi:flagella basal body P-ring formation protein FlgA